MLLMKTIDYGEVITNVSFSFQSLAFSENSSLVKGTGANERPKIDENETDPFLQLKAPTSTPIAIEQSTGGSSPG